MTTGGEPDGYVSADEALRFVERADFVWHQRFQLAPGVYAPGANDIEWLLGVSGLLADLEGLSVLDVGTTNGGAAFEAERRGARRVVAIDIFGPHWFGFSELKDLLGSGSSTGGRARTSSPASSTSSSTSFSSSASSITFAIRSLHSTTCEP